MIFVKRTAVPAILSKNGARWLGELREARKKKVKSDYKKAESKYRSKPVRDSLDRMFSGKCAYCESLIGVVATAHIEHFRPKTKYPSLAFSWNNLLLGCPTCNDGAHKGTKFPKAAEGGPLIDPTIENPNLHLEFVYEPISKLVLARAITPRGKLVIDLFGLNTRPDLVRCRTD